MPQIILPFRPLTSPVTKPIPDYLRVYSERSAPQATANALSPRWIELFRSFERATGWPLEFAPGPAPAFDFDSTWTAPVDPGVGVAPGHVRIDLISRGEVGGEHRAEVGAAVELARCLVELVTELAGARGGEGASPAKEGVAIPVAPPDEGSLSARLEAALRGGAEGIGCSAAAVYLLDPGTTELTARAQWGLAPNSDPQPRSLGSANADVEALAGHAVVVSDAKRQATWRLPEPFAAGLCVPVSSPTMPLGTLWCFADERREFSDREVQLAEIVAGRIAADLERESLLTELRRTSRMEREWAEGQRCQQNQMPRVAPLLDDWDLWGWTEQADRLGGEFHDWFMRSDDLLTIALGGCRDFGLGSAISISAIRAALRAHGENAISVDQLLERINRTHWTGSAGDQAADMFLALVDTVQGKFNFAFAGEPAAVLLTSGGWESLSAPSIALGLSPGASFRAWERLLTPGTVLAVASAGLRKAMETGPGGTCEARLAELLAPRRNCRSKALAEIARDRFGYPEPGAPAHGGSLLILKRRS